MTDIGVKLLHPQAQVPVRKLDGDAGADLTLVTPLVLLPGCRGLACTGIAIELPAGSMGLVMPRSGLALSSGVTVLNAPGLIDAGYRGEIKVLLVNLGDETVELTPGTRVAQLVVSHYLEADFMVRDELTDTLRGDGGFGHTGQR